MAATRVILFLLLLSYEGFYSINDDAYSWPPRLISRQGGGESPDALSRMLATSIFDCVKAQHKHKIKTLKYQCVKTSKCRRIKISQDQNVYVVNRSLTSMADRLCSSDHRLCSMRSSSERLFRCVTRSALAMRACAGTDARMSTCTFCLQGEGGAKKVKNQK